METCCLKGKDPHGKAKPNQERILEKEIKIYFSTPREISLEKTNAQVIFEHLGVKIPIVVLLGYTSKKFSVALTELIFFTNFLNFEFGKLSS